MKLYQIHFLSNGYLVRAASLCEERCFFNSNSTQLHVVKGQRIGLNCHFSYDVPTNKLFYLNFALLC